MSLDMIFENLSSDLDDSCPTEEQVMSIIEDLLEGRYLVERPHDDDSIIYEARPGLQWPDFSDLSDVIKRTILTYLVENPKTFFVLYNTQKGKSQISALEMRRWADAEDVKVVSVVIVDNDRTLADQSADGFLRSFPNVFTLSSNTKTKIDEILAYIDAYGSDVYDEYKMPVIVALQNDAQVARVVQILGKIQGRANHPTRPSKLRYGILVDEADKTYPPIRNRLLPFIGDPKALHRIGFVTATEGELLEDFEECCTAHAIQTDTDSPDYCAIHTPDAVVHRTELASKKQKPNDYAEMVIRNNLAHFAEPIRLSTGEMYYRKTIVNGNTSLRDMDSFARNRVSDGHYAMTFNKTGITVYTPSGGKRTHKIKGKRLNETIMCLYKKLGLHDRPLFIVGRRKVDRGLGFHYAPRTADDHQIDFGGELIDIRGGEGFVATDLILGRVEDKCTAVQKAGRLAGIVAQCPQYPGALHYWTDERTARLVVHHNQVVDAANGLQGAYSVLQATTRAREQVAEPAATNSRPRLPISEQTFNTKEDAQRWCDDNCRFVVRERRDGTVKIYGKSTFGLYKLAENGSLVKCSERQATHIKYRGESRLIQDEISTRNSSDLGLGVEDSARIMPVKLDNNRIGYIVIYKQM